MPQTWHFGLVAKWWAEFNTGGPEIAYYQRYVERGQPALDAGCGAGRLLVPWLRAGLDVDGCDVSPDMVALSREQARREGLTATVFAQPLHELDPPRAYRTIVVCGAFGLGTTREQDVEGLRRLHEHLEPGGTLLLDQEAPYAPGSNARRWPYFLEERRRELPKPWPPPGERRRGADGAEYELRTRLAAVDAIDQLHSIELRASMWRDDELVTEEQHRIDMRLYFRNELLLMLKHVGFRGVDVRGDYSDDEATSEHRIWVFHARK